MKVKEILGFKESVVYSVSPESTVAEAVATMADKDIGSLMCLQGGKLVGVLTFREVLRTVRERGNAWGAAAVGEVMLRDTPTVDLQVDVDSLRRLMLDSHARYLPVVENGEVIGVLSFHDIAKAVLEVQSFENKMLMAYIHDIPQAQKHS